MNIEIYAVFAMEPSKHFANDLFECGSIVVTLVQTPPSYAVVVMRLLFNRIKSKVNEPCAKAVLKMTKHVCARIAAEEIRPLVLVGSACSAQEIGLYSLNHREKETHRKSLRQPGNNGQFIGDPTVDEGIALAQSILDKGDLENRKWNPHPLLVEYNLVGKTV